MSDAIRELKEAYHEYGYFRCTLCEGRVDISDAQTFVDAYDKAIKHHKENHD
jgi:transcription initiation factor IIE alpha subunit